MTGSKYCKQYETSPPLHPLLHLHIPHPLQHLTLPHQSHHDHHHPYLLHVHAHQSPLPCSSNARYSLAQENHLHHYLPLPPLHPFLKK
ncbi:hypothetical protein GOBAR_DD04034 [Gossypium barbadense]|nr:hypothetical protein GOBAR_DD04034 [Gossypium barbadense]